MRMEQLLDMSEKKWIECYQRTVRVYWQYFLKQAGALAHA
jgi:hypothetical protein